MLRYKFRSTNFDVFRTMGSALQSKALICHGLPHSSDSEEEKDDVTQCQGYSGSSATVWAA